MKPIVSFVVAVARNGVIGQGNALPWHLPADLKHFKAVTLGKPILMGRKTFASIGKPLPGRTNLVLTRDRSWRTEGTLSVHSVDEAIERAHGQPELACIGGAEVFDLLLPYASRIHMTRVAVEVSGDAFFPALDASSWVEVDRSEHPADASNAYPFTFVTLQRARTSAG